MISAAGVFDINRMEIQCNFRLKQMEVYVIIDICR